MTGYELSRNWFDWAFENPDLNTPTHTATYMWIIDKWNRSGQVKKLVLPSSESMVAIGVKSYNTYIKVLHDLISYGFIEMVQKSKNQYTANIIAILNIDKALDKALDKAMIKHTTKQSESIIQSTGESIYSIYKQGNKETKEQDNNETIEDKSSNVDLLSFLNTTTGKAFKVITSKAEKNVKLRLKEGFTNEDIKRAIVNCSKNKYHIENPQYLTLEFITRADNLEKYLNAAPVQMAVVKEIRPLVNYGRYVID